MYVVLLPNDKQNKNKQQNSLTHTQVIPEQITMLKAQNLTNTFKWYHEDERVNDWTKMTQWISFSDSLLIVTAGGDLNEAGFELEE